MTVIELIVFTIAILPVLMFIGALLYEIRKDSLK